MSSLKWRTYFVLNSPPNTAFTEVFIIPQEEHYRPISYSVAASDMFYFHVHQVSPKPLVAESKKQLHKHLS